MKILSLGLDNSVLDRTSALAARVIEYGNLVEKYTIIVPSARKEKIILSEKVKVYGSGGGNKLARLIKIYNLAKELWREEKYHIITVQDQYYLALIGLKLAGKHKLGLEIQVHGFEKYYGVRELIAKYVLPRADAVRVVSQRLKRQLVSRFGVKEEKITVASIWIDLRINDYDLRNKQIKKERGKFVFLTVSRLVSVKNIALQIEAMVEVVKKYPVAELWIVGDGPEGRKLEIKSHKLKVENNVKFFGWRNDLGRFYEQADAFLLTSNTEGWGIVVIATASWGLPIIMTDVGCAGEVIKNGQSGLVIPVGDRQKLVEAMLKIIENKELREKLGRNAVLAVNQLLTKEQTLELYKKSWEKAMKNR